MITTGLSRLRAIDTARWMLSLALAASVFALSGSSVDAQRRTRGPATGFSADDLLKPGALPDVVLGSPDAPVVIVEYASFDCVHCATFHNTVLPELKTRFIDTGKVRYIFRDFPLSDAAAAMAMLGRCAGPDKREAVVGAYFAAFQNWKGAPNLIDALFTVAKTQGFTQETFDRCLTDQKLLDGITEVRDRASKFFGVKGTPVFFVNGQLMSGRSDQIATFDAAIAAATPKPQ